MYGDYRVGIRVGYGYRIAALVDIVNINLDLSPIWRDLVLYSVAAMSGSEIHNDLYSCSEHHACTFLTTLPNRKWAE